MLEFWLLCDSPSGILTLHLRILLEGRQQSPRRPNPDGKNAVFSWRTLTHSDDNDGFESVDCINCIQSAAMSHLRSSVWNATPTPPLFQALVREFCPSLSEASSRTFPFTAMSSSPGTMPPAGEQYAPSVGSQPEATG